MKTILNIKELRLNDIMQDDEVVYRIIHIGDEEFTMEFLGLFHDDRFTPIMHRRPITRKRVQMRRMSHWLREKLRL